MITFLDYGAGNVRSLINALESLGETVKIIAGSRNNLKITNQEDLKLAQALSRINASDL